MSRDTPSSNDDTIDSRDVITRIEDLHDELTDAFDADRAGPLGTLHERSEDALELDHNQNEDLAQAAAEAAGGTYVREPYEREEFDAEDLPDPAAGEFVGWAEGASEDSSHPLYSEANEYDSLIKLASQGEGFGDWSHGATLIRDSYFKEYAQELAEETGAIDRNACWMLNCIDWDQAVSELQVDYMAVDFDGVAYWMRA